jgi:hypothetical protein
MSQALSVAIRTIADDIVLRSPLAMGVASEEWK